MMHEEARGALMTAWSMTWNHVKHTREWISYLGLGNDAFDTTTLVVCRWLHSGNVSCRSAHPSASDDAVESICFCARGSCSGSSPQAWCRPTLQEGPFRRSLQVVVLVREPQIFFVSATIVYIFCPVHCALLCTHRPPWKWLSSGPCLLALVQHAVSLRGMLYFVKPFRCILLLVMAHRVVK